MKKLLLTAVFFAAAAAQAATVTGFTGAYGVFNWATEFTSACTGCSTTHSPTTLTLVGADDPEEEGAPNQFTDRYITVATSGKISFHWQYSTKDEYPEWDPFGIIVDDGSGILFTQLSDDSGSTLQSGDFSYMADAGDIFGFRVWSLDSIGGAATGVINNFSVAEVPEPATLALLGIGMLGAAAARRRRIDA